VAAQKRVAGKTPPGRPRDLKTERYILEIALQRLAEDGYSRMTVDDVALRAGVSKPTIYRRWANKADLATAAVRTLQLSEPRVRTGSAKGDLIAILRNFRRNLLRPNGLSLIGTVLAEEHHTPELLRLFRKRIVAPRRRMLRDVLTRAAAEGSIRKRVDPGVVASMLAGAFYGHYLANPRIREDFVDRIVDVVWKGIAV
jgi:AcrR family transcriptional regulator